MALNAGRRQYITWLGHLHGPVSKPTSVFLAGPDPTIHQLSDCFLQPQQNNPSDRQKEVVFSHLCFSLSFSSIPPIRHRPSAIPPIFLTRPSLCRRCFARTAIRFPIFYMRQPATPLKMFHLKIVIRDAVSEPLWSQPLFKVKQKSSFPIVPSPR